MEKKKSKNYIKIELKECPYNIRNLKEDECYSGMGENKCKYFIRYNWKQPHYGYIVCKCNESKNKLFTEEEMRG